MSCHLLSPTFLFLPSPTHLHCTPLTPFTSFKSPGVGSDISDWDAARPGACRTHSRHFDAPITEEHVASLPRRPHPAPNFS